MALFKSPWFSEIRNTVAGMTFFKGPYGTIIGRARVKPVDVNSNALELVRQQFSASVAGWHGLSLADRTTWDDFALGTPWKNALGDDIRLSGFNMYIAQVGAWISAFPEGNRASLNAAPCVPGLFPLPSLRFACCADPDVGIIVNVANNHPTNLMNAIVRISRAQQFTRNHFTGPHTGMDPIVLSGIAAGSDDDAEFCNLCVGRFHVSVRAFDASTGNNMSRTIMSSSIACTAAP